MLSVCDAIIIDILETLDYSVSTVVAPQLVGSFAEKKDREEIYDYD